MKVKVSFSICLNTGEHLDGSHLFWMPNGFEWDSLIYDTIEGLYTPPTGETVEVTLIEKLVRGEWRPVWRKS